MSTINVLKACADSNVKRLVYSTSSSAYGNTVKLPSKEEDPINPISPYASKNIMGSCMQDVC